MRYMVSLWRRLDSSLRARILLPTVVLFAGTLLAMAAGAVKLHEADMNRHQHERAELFTEMVANGLTTLMLQGDPARVPDLLTVVAGHRSDIDSISLLHPKGHIAFSSKRGQVGQRPFQHLERFDRLTVID